MAIPGSGTISINDLKTEFGATGTRGLTDFYRGGSFVPDIAANSGVPTSGTIELTDFYGSENSSLPLAPSYVVISTFKGSALKVDWTDNATDETSYEAEYKLNDGSWTAFTASPYAANTTTAQQLNSSWEKAEARVRAVNASGESAWVEADPFYNLNAPSSLALVNTLSPGMAWSFTDNSAYEDGFLIEGDVNGDDLWSIIEISSENDTAGNFNASSALGASPGDNVQIRVSAKRGTSYSLEALSSVVELN